MINWNKFLIAAKLYSFNVAAAACILVIGHLMAKWLAWLVERSMRRARLHQTLVIFIRHVIFYGLMTAIVIAAINKLGIATTSFLAVMGAVSLAIALALQGSLANLASGVLLILFNSFDIGDVIEAGGSQGTVVDLQLFNTVLLTADHKKIVIPNGKITADKITVFPK